MPEIVNGETVWTDENRPHGTVRLAAEGAMSADTEYWDRALMAWVDDGRVVREPQRPSEELMLDIERLFVGAVDRDHQYPLLLVREDPVLDEHLHAFAFHFEARLTMLELAVRGRMKERWDATPDDGDSPYDVRTRNDFKFSLWKERAADTRRAVRRELSRSNLSDANRQRIEDARRAREERARSATTQGDSDLRPEQMIESNSMLLVAAGHILMKRPRRIWYDDFYHDIMTDWTCNGSVAYLDPHAMRDADVISLMMWLHSLDPALSRLSKQGVKHALQYVANLDHRHVVKEWVMTLRWDRVERLHEVMCGAFRTEETPYTQRLGINWFVAMVARVVDPGCKVDFMPVFFGAQGEQKTKALQVIAGERWYDDITDKSDSKDFLMKLRGKWLLEIAEMHSIASSRSELAHVKAMLTRQEDRFRPPYGDAVESFKRQMVFAGTTNRDDWHTDETGGRRFGPVKCGGRIDIPWLRDNREQLFAEALAKYEDGWEWWLLPEEAHREALSQQQAGGPFDNVISDWIEQARRRGRLYDGRPHVTRPVLPDINDSTDRWGNIVTSERVAVEWLGMTLSDVARHQREIGSALRRLGWTRKYGRLGVGSPMRHWVCMEPQSGNEPELPLHDSATGFEERLEDEPPF